MAHTLMINTGRYIGANNAKETDLELCMYVCVVRARVLCFTYTCLFHPSVKFNLTIGGRGWQTRRGKNGTQL